MDRRSPKHVAPPLVGGVEPHEPPRTHDGRYRTWGRSRSVRLPGFDYTEHAPCHVTIRARAGTVPFCQDPIAKMVCTTLKESIEQGGAYLGAFCLMPDHLHVLLSPDGSGLALGELVGRFKGLTTNRSWRLGWAGALWQCRFYDHIVRRQEGIREVARYIYENSDRRGLPADYLYRFVAENLV